MAFIQEIELDGEGKSMFNVTHAVGTGAQNFWTDIQLVQYLIIKIYTIGMDGIIWGIPLSFAEADDLPNPNKDFKNLKKTERWIRRFQTDGSHKSIRLKIDGRVDRARGEISPITSTFYTIVALNAIYDAVLREAFNDDDPFVTALDDGFMPTMLREQLLNSRG